jgi:RND family efflux transporter MFP subunit
VRANSLIAALLTVTLCSAAPPEVTVVKPIEKEITDHANLTGRTEPSTTVDIRSRVSGYLEKVLFKEGSLVKKGEILFQLDDRAQKAALAKAEAEVRVADAKLKIAEASVQRMMQLLKQAAIAKEELEMAQATMEAAKAEVNAARAGLDVGKLNLEYTRIASPINGRIGRSNVDAGNLVKADGDTVLANVIVTDQLYVAFDLDERTILRLIRLNRDGKDTKIAVGLAFTDEDGYPHKATLDFMDNKLNAETGTIRCRAQMDNPKGDVLPGMFAKVRIALGEPHKVLLVPASATYRDAKQSPNVYFVYVIDEKNVVVERQIRVGTRVGDDLAIEDGLKPGERILEDYNCGARPGTEITPKEKKPSLGKKPGDGGVSAPRPMPELPINGPALIVTTTYPGADAHTVEETVAGPISKELASMEGLVHQFSTCTNDGALRLTLVLKKGTDLRTAQVVAQNRVALASPRLPEAVNRQGIAVKRRTVHLLNVVVTSPTGRYDRQYLANYASLQICDELARVAGVGDVAFHGDAGPTPQVQIQFDKVKLAAFGLTMADAMHAVQAEITPSGLVKPGIALVDRPKDIDAMGDIVVKFVREGQPLKLRDVARIELVSGWSTTTTLDGKSCVILLVSRTFDADAKETEKAVRERLKKLQEAAPAGIELRVVDE